MYEFEKLKLKNYLGKTLYETFKEYKVYIAGGTITSLFCNRDINDIDVYFRSEKDLVDYLEGNWTSKHWIVSHTKKATLIKYDNEIDVQFIHFDYFKKAEDIFNTFDFTVCMGAFDFETEEFILHEDFLKHNSQRLLQFNSKTSFPIVSALRVQKYKEKGYCISKPEYIRILLACMKLKINTYKELKEQMGGMYGINYDKLFKNEEEFSLENVIIQLENLCVDDDYFKEPRSIHFDDVEDLIESITCKKSRCVKLNDKYYRINSNNELTKDITNSIDNPFGENNLKLNEDITVVDAEEFMKDKKFYKFVKKSGDRYFSYYDNSYEWKLNEEMRPSYKTQYSNVLYCGELRDIGSLSYSNERDNTLLELSVKHEDFVRASFPTIEVRKCTVIREVPKEEYKDLLDR